MIENLPENQFKNPLELNKNFHSVRKFNLANDFLLCCKFCSRSSHISSILLLVWVKSGHPKLTQYNTHQSGMSGGNYSQFRFWTRQTVIQSIPSSLFLSLWFHFSCLFFSNLFLDSVFLLLFCSSSFRQTTAKKNITKENEIETVNNCFPTGAKETV